MMLIMKNTIRKINLMIFLLLMFQAKIEAVIDLEIDTADMIVLNRTGQVRNHLFNHWQHVEEILQEMDKWASKKVAIITQSKEFNLTKFKNVEKLVNTIQNNITELSLELSKNNDNINDIKKRSSILLNDLEKLDRELNNNTRKSIQLLGIYLGDKSEIINKSASFYNQMGIIIEEIKKKESLPLTNVIINAIRSKQYVKVVLFLTKLKYEHEIKHIIKTIYNDTEENIDLILQIGNKVKNGTVTFLLYKSLSEELDINNKIIDCNKIIRFIKACKKTIHQLQYEPNLRMEAKYLINHLENKLKISGKNYLKETLLTFNNEFSLEDSKFRNMFDLNDELLATICLEVISELNTNDSNHSSNVDKFKFILNKLIDMYLHNNKYKLKLAFFIKNLKTLNDNIYQKMIDNEIINLKNNLPIYAINLVFADKICIKNRGLNRYLHLSEEEFDNNKYTVHTKQIDENDLKLNDAWRIDRYEEHTFYIKNVAKEKSDLFVDTDVTEHSFYESTEGQSVYVIAGNDTHRDAIWIIDPYYCAYGCFILNTPLSRNLYATEDTNYIPHVGPINLRNADHWKWYFIDCSHIIN